MKNKFLFIFVKLSIYVILSKLQLICDIIIIIIMHIEQYTLLLQAWDWPIKTIYTNGKFSLDDFLFVFIGYDDVGDLMLVTVSGFWGSNLEVGHQNSVTFTSNLSSSHIVSNIRHQLWFLSLDHFWGQVELAKTGLG